MKTSEIRSKLIRWAEARERRNPEGHGWTGTVLLRKAANRLLCLGPASARLTLLIFYTDDERWCWQVIDNNTGAILSAAGSYGKVNDAWFDARKAFVSKVERL
jgi:hypothetical protein